MVGKEAQIRDNREMELKLKAVPAGKASEELAKHGVSPDTPVTIYVGEDFATIAARMPMVSSPFLLRSITCIIESGQRYTTCILSRRVNYLVEIYYC